MECRLEVVGDLLDRRFLALMARALCAGLPILWKIKSSGAVFTGDDAKRIIRDDVDAVRAIFAAEYPERIRQFDRMFLDA